MPIITSQYDVLQLFTARHIPKLEPLAYFKITGCAAEWIIIAAQRFRATRMWGVKVAAIASSRAVSNGSGAGETQIFE
jgi:hypothetical protein